MMVILIVVEASGTVPKDLEKRLRNWREKKNRNHPKHSTVKIEYSEESWRAEGELLSHRLH